MKKGAAVPLLALLAGPAAAAEVAVLKSADVAAWRPAIEALRRAAPGHTYTEYDLRNDRAAAEQTLATLRGRNVVLVALGPVAAQAARTALPDAPLVFSMIHDPERYGLSVGPGVAGVSFRIPARNQIAAFRLVNPRGTRIGVVYHPENSGKLVEEADKASGMLRILLVSRPVTAAGEVPPALRAMLTGEDAVDALWLPADALLVADETRRYILAEVTKANRPVYTFSSSIVAEGALVSNGPDYASIGEQMAELVLRLAAGERGRIEMLVPRAELVINRKIAGKLRIDIPAEALKAATKVF
jgi:putative ABC transport system substrate-binding protein